MSEVSITLRGQRLTVDYTWETASGDGWNEPHYPARTVDLCVWDGCRDITPEITARGDLPLVRSLTEAAHKKAEADADADYVISAWEFYCA